MSRGNWGQGARASFLQLFALIQGTPFNGLFDPGYPFLRETYPATEGISQKLFSLKWVEKTDQGSEKNVEYQELFGSNGIQGCTKANELNLRSFLHQQTSEYFLGNQSSLLSWVNASEDVLS